MTPIRPGGSGTESRLITDMNVTPMVDVMLVLLVILSAAAMLSMLVFMMMMGMCYITMLSMNNMHRNLSFHHISVCKIAEIEFCAEHT